MSLDEAYIEKIQEALTEFLNQESVLANECGPSYTSRSIAASEYATSARPESIVTACSIAEQLIAYSAEHLSLFVDATTEPIKSLASWTCIRSMLEACAISVWLFDPTIHAEQRIGRAFAMRYVGLLQQLKYGRCINQPAEEIQGLADRIDKVEQDALALGFLPILDSRGDRIGIGQRMPSATELIKSELEEESMYRLLSAVAHGHSWALLPLGFQPKDPNGISETVGDGTVKEYEKKVYVNGLAYLGLHGAKSFARALWNKYQYMGWELSSLEEILEKVFDVLQANPEVRFWRSK